MSDDKTLIKIRQLAEAAEREVATSPARIFNLLLDLALNACEADGGAAQRGIRIDKARAGLAATVDYLEGDLISKYRAVNVTLPPDVMSAAKEIRAILRSALSTLGEDTQVPATTIGDTAEHIRDTLQTPVDVFLSALFAMVVEAEGARGRRGHNLDSAAVEQIGDISSRINLIAVNASIEAARVGEAGRGFAVIANEIQELSRKSEDAVRNIRNNIV